MPLDRRDQCASFEPLIVHFGKGPLTAGQPGLSALVVDGPKTTIPWSRTILEKIHHRIRPPKKR